MSAHDNSITARSGKRVEKRYLAGAGAAACAVCCAAPILALLGIAGTGLAAAVATMALAGATFGLVVLLGTVLAVFLGRRRESNSGCHSEASSGPVMVQLSSGPADPTGPAAG